MQRIERYGVIALVFLLVTILAVSLWGESKDGGLLSFFGGGSKKAAPTEAKAPRKNPAAAPAPGTPPAGATVVGERAPGDRMLPLHEGAQPPVAGGPANPATTAQDPYAAVRAPGSALPTPLNTGAAGTQTPVATPLGGQPLAGTPVQPLGQGPAGNAVARGAATPPVASTPREYVVKSGDTLGEIASRELGSTARWTEIQQLNGGLAPEKLKVGMKLKLPAGGTTSKATPAPGVATKTQPAPAGSRTYVVRAGDTLGAIASRELGSASRWTAIAELNPSVDPARLAVGAKLVLPAGAATPRSTPAADAGERIAYAPVTAGKKSRVQ